MLDSIIYQQKNSKNSRKYVNCHKKLYNNMNLYFCSDLGCQKLVKSMAKIYIKTYNFYKLYFDGPGIRIKRQLYYLVSQWLKSAATPGVCTMS